MGMLSGFVIIAQTFSMFKVYKLGIQRLTPLFSPRKRGDYGGGV